MIRLLPLLLLLCGCSYPIDEPPGTRLTAAQLLKSEGCLLCHSLDGTEEKAPSFDGLWGRRVTVETDGTLRTLTADAEYVRRSIVDPDADLVDGYEPGEMKLTDLTTEQVAEIVEALRLLSERAR